MKTTAVTVPSARRRIPIALLLFALLLPGALLAQAVEVNKPLPVVALMFQQKLPAVAVDQMIEAQRLGAGWEFRFQLAQQKGWVDEVIVVVKQKTAMTCEYTVKVSRIEGSLFGSKRELQPAASAEWTAKIGQLVAEGIEAGPDG